MPIRDTMVRCQGAFQFFSEDGEEGGGGDRVPLKLHIRMRSKNETETGMGDREKRSELNRREILESSFPPLGPRHSGSKTTGPMRLKAPTRHERSVRLLARLEKCTPRPATMSLINRRMYTQSTTNHIYPNLEEPPCAGEKRRRSLFRNSGNVSRNLLLLPRRRRRPVSCPAKRLTNRDAMRSWRFFKTVAAIRRAYYDEERILRHRHRGRNPALLPRSRYERQRINTRPIYSPSFHPRLRRLPSMTLTSRETSGCRVIF